MKKETQDIEPKFFGVQYGMKQIQEENGHMENTFLQSFDLF